jgi:hypothetical protein
MTYKPLSIFLTLACLSLAAAAAPLFACPNYIRTNGSTYALTESYRGSAFICTYDHPDLDPDGYIVSESCRYNVSDGSQPLPSGTLTGPSAEGCLLIRMS